jgi:hypothetical protein
VFEGAFLSLPCFTCTHTHTHTHPHTQVDVEGFEWRVFEGAQGLLRRHEVPHIVMEYSPGVLEHAKMMQESEATVQMLIDLVRGLFRGGREGGREGGRPSRECACRGRGFGGPLGANGQWGQLARGASGGLTCSVRTCQLSSNVFLPYILPLPQPSPPPLPLCSSPPSSPTNRNLSTNTRSGTWEMGRTSPRQTTPFLPCWRSRHSLSSMTCGTPSCTRCGGKVWSEGCGMYAVCAMAGGSFSQARHPLFAWGLFAWACETAPHYSSSPLLPSPPSPPPHSSSSPHSSSPLLSFHPSFSSP